MGAQFLGKYLLEVRVTLKTTISPNYRELICLGRCRNNDIAQCTRKEPPARVVVTRLTFFLKNQKCIGLNSVATFESHGVSNYRFIP